MLQSYRYNIRIIITVTREKTPKRYLWTEYDVNTVNYNITSLVVNVLYGEGRNGEVPI